MSFFKKRVTQAGKQYFYKDGKAVKEADVDALPAIIKNMEAGNTIELDIPEQPVAQSAAAPVNEGTAEPEAHVSVISGEPATRRRWLNGIEYWITEEEHKLYNLGKLAQAIRERSTTPVVDDTRK